MARYAEHPSKASRFDGRDWVVHEDAANEDCTVWVCVERDEDGDDHRWEGLLGRRLAPDRARIAAVPVFVGGLAFGDEVSLVESGEGALVVTGVVRPSGNATFRVLLPRLNGPEEQRWHRGPEPVPGDTRWRDLIVELEPLGCWFDVYDPRYVAISAPSSSAATLAELLERRAREGDWRWEAGQGR